MLRLSCLLAVACGGMHMLHAQEARSATEPPPLLRAASEVAYPPFCMTDQNGPATGFAVELLEAAARKMGREITFEVGVWENVKQMLAEGEIDALPFVGRTPEREDIFDFTAPYLTMHGAIVVREGEKEIDSLSDLEGRTVAVMKADNAEEFLRREERGIDIRTTATFADALANLSDGHFDAVFIQRLIALRLIKQKGLANLRVIDKPVEEFRQEFCFAVREGDKDTLELLNEGLALTMADGTFRQLHAKWFAALQLPSYRTIIVGGDHNYPPFEYLDAEGNPTGFNVELTRAVAKAMGLDVEIRLGPWTEIREGLKDGRIDIIQGMLYSAERDKEVDFSPPYTVTNYVAVVRQDGIPPPASINDLETKQNIAVQNGDLMHDFAVEHGLGKRLAVFNTQEEALEAVVDGRSDCALVARMTALYWIEKRGWDEDLAVANTALASPEYCFAAAPENDAILAQFSEGLRVLEENSEYRRIYNKWLGVYTPERTDMKTILFYVAIVAGPLLVLLLLLFAWSRTLRYEVARRTEELERSQWLLHRTQRIATVGGWQYDVRTGEMTWTREVYRIHGVPEDYNPNAIDADLGFYAESHRKLLEHSFRSAVDKGKPYDIEAPFQAADGKAKWVRTAGIPEMQDGQVVRVVGHIMDITDLHKAQEALAASERRYRKLYEEAPVGIFTTDSTGRVHAMNPSMAHILGFDSPQDALAHYRDLASQVYVDPARRRDFVNQLEADGEVERFEYEAKRVDGQHIWLSMSARRTERNADGTFMIEGFTTDVTARRQAQAKVESLSRFPTENPHPVLRITADGIVEYANQAARPILDQILRTAEGQRVDSEWADYIAQSLSDGKTRELEVEAGNRIFSAAVAPIPEHGYANIYAMDVTDQRQLEVRLRQAEKMEAVGRLAGGVAHDFNNLIMGIMNYVELCREEIPPDKPIREWLDEIANCAERSASLTRQLLAFARKQTINPQVLDLNETVSGMLKMLQRVIGEDIDLEWDPGSDIGTVKMDPSQLDQILVNLTTNARDAIKGVGKITIETANTSFNEEYCSKHPGFKPGDYVMLAVSDDGQGMDKETLSQVFEPFFSTKGTGQGTGLGLATVYGIVKQNEGFVNVYSEPEGGTTFRIYLTRHAAGTASGAPSRKAQHTQPPGGTETVLLVEDAKPIRVTARIFLQRLGYTVIEAEAPDEALRKVQDFEGEIDLLITDVVLPGMNGRELAEKMLGTHPTMRCIYMSGYTANVIAHRGILDKDVDFLTKPFTRDSLAVKVREVLDRQ